MKTTLKIAKSEFNTLFYSPIAWLLCIIFIFQCTLTYTPILQQLLTVKNLGLLKDLSFLTSSLFSAPTPPNTLFPMVVTKVYLYIPLLTMGLMSREISSGTIKLLYSSPIRIRQIIFGKFLSMMAYNLILLMIVGVFVISGIITIPSFDYGEVMSGLLGIYLLLCTYTAIGLFMSCLTSYQVVAAISTLAVFAVLDYVGTIWQSIDFVRDLTYFLSISGRTQHMLSGLIGTNDILYFVLIISMFLTFCVIKLQGERESKSSLATTGKYLATVAAVLFIGYLSGLPILTAYYDATATKGNTLTPNTRKILKEMGNEPLEVTSYINLLDQYYWRGTPESRNKDLERWEPYLRFKKNITLKYVYYYDPPLGDPVFLKTNPGKTIKQVAESMAKVLKIDLSSFKTPEEIRKIIDLRPELNRYVMQLKYRGKSTFLRVYDDYQVFPREPETGAALKRLIVKLPKIIFLEGEYERSTKKEGDREYSVLPSDKKFRFSLINQGFDVDTVSLENNEIPADIAGLIIPDPRINFSPKVLAKLQKYISAGGNVFIAGEPGKQDVLNPLIKPLGVQLMDGTLVQKSRNAAPNFLMPFLTKSALGIFKNLKPYYADSVYVTMPGAAGLTYTKNGLFQITPLLTSDKKTSWNKKGKLVIDSADVNYNAAEGDEKKSFSTVVGLTRRISGKEQRIIVTGDADFLSNMELTRNGSCNFIFGTDLFGWFTYGQFPIDTERPDSPDNKLDLTDQGFVVMKVIDFGIIPGLLLISGVVFLLRRKRR